MEIQKKLDHKNIVKVHNCGENGIIKKANGNVIDGLFYLVMDYVPEGLMYDIIEHFEGVGELVSRFFLKQLLDSLEYLQENQIVHRDLKLENILVNSKMELKITDFGFATYYNKNKTKGYGGTLSYMAPEVSELKLYDGYKADIFSMGVIFFITTIGNFPFPEGTKQDKYYNLLTSSKPEKVLRYWSQVGAEEASDEFKDLFSKMIAYKPSNRPSLKEIREHPYMQMKVKTTDEKI